ncbi:MULTISPECIES: glycosyltransferase family 39 protein [Pseudanabaena]|uniref:glycosyltransferase family 39 protein n=1 Tax=Pseudanabaena TaxID=1152 RepID=UPI00247B254A|nr:MULTISPECIES: glycosyltransferase family 39 protein [Pseudanabaena]MEA5487766.1 glycosyltransferase family 39 protein [Pseudanabaena sp. CCNP1317]WGS72496.1 glycosyltransferase family 39 protein [Pseudanabaena galeata CCNP1313]
MLNTKLGKLKYSENNWLYIFLIVVIILGIVIRCIHIDHRVYWGDEIVTSLRMAGSSYVEAIQNLTNKSILSISDLLVYQQPRSTSDMFATVQGLISEEPQHVPVYFVLARLWIQFFGSFGNSVVVIRSFSVFVSLLSLVCLYCLCIELFRSKYIGLIALAMVAVSPFHLVYAQEARPPALWILSITLSSTLLLRAARLNTKLSWSAYAISVVLSLYTFLFSILVFVSHGIYILLMQRFQLNKVTKFYLVSMLVGILLFIPWLLVIISKLKVINNATGWSSEKIGSLNLLKGIFNNFRDVFFDIGKGYSYLTFFLIIITIFSLYFLWVKAPKSISIFVFSIIGVTIASILLPDLLNGGAARSGASRYFIAPYLGIHLSLTYLFYRCTNYLSKRIRISGQIVITLLILLGLLSCISISQSEQSFNQATYRNGIALANMINKYDNPLVITNAKYSNNLIGIINLSYRLKPDSQFQMVGDARERLSESSKSIFIYGGDSDSLIDTEKTKYEPQLIFDDRDNECCSENLWYLKPR